MLKQWTRFFFSFSFFLFFGDTLTDLPLPVGKLHKPGYERQSPFSEFASTPPFSKTHLQNTRFLVLWCLTNLIIKRVLWSKGNNSIKFNLFWNRNPHIGLLPLDYDCRNNNRHVFDISMWPSHTTPLPLSRLYNCHIVSLQGRDVHDCNTVLILHKSRFNLWILIYLAPCRTRSHSSVSMLSACTHIYRQHIAQPQI